MKTPDPARAKRRNRQLEKCLRDVAGLLFERAVEINAAGRDKSENAEYRFLKSTMARINRTMASTAAGEQRR